MIEISSAVSSSMSSTSAGIVVLLGDLRGAPAALAGDQLEAAVVERPDEDRLEDAVLADATRRALRASPRRTRGAAARGLGSMRSTGTMLDARVDGGWPPGRAG